LIKALELDASLWASVAIISFIVHKLS